MKTNFKIPTFETLPHMAPSREKPTSAVPRRLAKPLVSIHSNLVQENTSKQKQKQDEMQ
jgi:hypothetical protein